MYASMLLIMFFFLPEYPLPDAAIKALNAHFHNWEVMKPRKEDEQYDPAEYSYYRCNLNNDNISDFSLVILTDRDSTIEEHIVALVSRGDEYDLFDLKTVKGPEKNFSNYFVYIQREQTYVVNFGFKDKIVPPELLTQSKGSGYYFNVDCIMVALREQNSCTSYVYCQGKFFRFSSCD